MNFKLPFNGNPRFVKWALMSAVIFWTVVYKLSELEGPVSGFVYANF